VSTTQFIAILGLKIIPEFVIITKGLSFFRKTSLILYFPLLEPAHILYVLVCGIHGLSDKFAWRGREYTKETIENNLQDTEKLQTD